jgi:hypothetical protein
VTKFVDIPRPDIHSASHCAARAVSISNAGKGARPANASKLMKLRALSVVLKVITHPKLLEERLLYPSRGLWPCHQTKFEVHCRRTNEKATEGFLVD